MGAFTALFSNPNNRSGDLQLFASTNSQCLATNQFAFGLPFAASYPSGSKINVSVNNVIHTVTLTSSKTREQIVDVLIAMNIATTWKLDTVLTSNTYLAYSSVNTYQSLEIISSVPVVIGFPAPAIGVGLGKIFIAGGIPYESSDGGSNFTQVANTYNSFPLGMVAKCFIIAYPYSGTGRVIGLCAKVMPGNTDAGAILNFYLNPVTGEWTSGGGGNVWAKSKYASISNKYLVHHPVGIGGAYLGRVNVTGTQDSQNTDAVVVLTMYEGASVITPSSFDYEDQFDMWNDSVNGSECIVFLQQTTKNVYYTLNGGANCTYVGDNILNIIGDGDIKVWASLENSKHAIYAACASGTGSGCIARTVVEDPHEQYQTWADILDNTNPATPYDTLEAFCVDFQKRPTVDNGQNLFALCKRGTEYVLFTSPDSGTTWSSTVLEITASETIQGMMFLDNVLYITTNTTFYKIQ